MKPILFLLLMLALALKSKAQEIIRSSKDNIDLSDKKLDDFLKAVDKKAKICDEKILKRSKIALVAILSEERKIQEKLMLIDSNAATAIFNNSFERYAAFEESLNQKAEKVIKKGFGNYIPYLDTIKTSLGFLSGSLTDNENLKHVISKIDGLKNRFDEVQRLQEFIKQRKAYLAQQLAKYNLGKELKKFNKELFYYSQTIKSYKDILSDPKKIEQMALTVLKKLPSFQNFLKRNSQLASFFGGPSTSGSQSSLTGLQTRASVQQLLTQSYTSATPASFVQQQTQNATNQSNEIRNKQGLLDAFGESVDIPDFKPNMQKTKPFIQRFEYGTNLQFGNTNRFLPTTADIALTIGYKLNDNGSFGIGSSYKLGLGKGLQNIHFTHQGLSLRSYVDWKLKGSIYMSGGYEKLYLPTLGNNAYHFDTWQESGLLGLSKKYKLNKKLKGSLQLLYDFLGYDAFPKRQPIVFRTGWNF